MQTPSPKKLGASQANLAWGKLLFPLLPEIVTFSVGESDTFPNRVGVGWDFPYNPQRLPQRSPTEMLAGFGLSIRRGMPQV